MKTFRDFESAREFVRKLKLKNYKEWQEYCKSGEKPNDIPSAPSATYKNNGWINNGDWLGTGNISNSKKKYYSYNDTKKIICKLNLKGQQEWSDYCKSGDKPDYVPAAPHQVYKNKGWVGYGDWLGTGNVHTKEFCSIYDAKKIIRQIIWNGNKLSSKSDYGNWAKSKNRPKNIPYSPDRTYKNEWSGWGDFLGTGSIAPKDKQYRPFKEAREFVGSLGLKTNREWDEYCKSGDKPDDIPATPRLTYKNDFKTAGDWLGTGTIAPQDKQFRPFKEAREFVRALHLKGDSEWREYCKSGNKPDDITSIPWNVYKKEGWKNLGDFLGTGTIANQNRIYRPFKEAREFVRALHLKTNREWDEYCKSGDKPDDIPSNPWNVYQEWNIKRREEKK
jgi:hypothetical protein